MQMVHATADPLALVQRVGALIEAGRAAAAAPLLAAARRLIEPSPELSQLAARLAESQGSLDLARAELDAAIVNEPGHAALLKQRASLCQRMGDLDRAARDASEAVILNPADPDAKALLGSTLLSLGRSAEAVICLAEACASTPGNAAFREALAIATETNGDPALALDILRAGLSPAGGALNLRNAAILFCIRHRDFTTAITLAEEGRAAGTVDACLFGLQGHALSSLGQHTEAAEAYADALKLGPDDPYVRHLVAASGLLPGAKRAPPDYLRTVFDGYAERFDEHLIGLGYQIPGAMRRVVMDYLASLPGTACGPVLDLGCGTGLIGVAISDLPMGALTGIDVSDRMLAEARAKGLYTTLEQADVLDWLAEDSRAWGLILAADVLCYFGALETLLRSVRARLAPNGWFVFSVEEREATPDAPDWALQRQGRYAHSSAYVADAAQDAGFRIRTMRPQTIRHEAGAPVPGLLVVLEPALPVH